MEEWKDIPNWPGYKASTLGRIKSFLKDPKGTILVTTKKNNKYIKVSLQRDGKPHQHRVHRLIIMTFLPRSNPDQFVVNHINNDRYDNRLCNLEWATQDHNLAQEWFKEQARYKQALSLLNDRQSIKRTIEQFVDHIFAIYKPSP
jgi:NUMOD4 motif/HNH endonuclease